MVTKMGWFLSADFDIGLSPQVTHVPPGERRYLLVEELLFDLFARRHVISLEFGLGLVTPHDDFDTCRINKRRRGLSRLRLGQLRLHLFAEILELHLAQVLIDGT